MRENVPKPVIFLAFANDLVDNVGYLRNLPEEYRLLYDALRPAERAGQCDLVMIQGATVEQVQNVFLDEEYRDRVALFHYGGHANGYELLLQSREGEGAAADAAGFARFLAEQQGLRLVFLNGCATEPQVDGLLEAGIDAVIATSQDIDDTVAMQFADRFYTALANGSPLGRAFRETEGALQMQYGSEPRDLYYEGANGGGVDRTLLPWELAWREESSDVALESGLRQWSHFLPFKRKRFEPETVLIPRGSFAMGAEGDAIPTYEGPKHEVTSLPMFRIGITPVTCRQYADYLDASRRSAPPVLGWPGNQPSAEQECMPVAGVDFFAAQGYCDWLNEQTSHHYVIPSEAEWEKAARGTEGWHYPWGDVWQEQRCNTDPDRITAVQAFKEGVSPYGCFDILGNVLEWTRSLWGEQRREPDPAYCYPWQNDRRNRADANDQIRRVVRGGLRTGKEVRVTMRTSQMPNQGGLGVRRVGFRVGMLLEEE